MPIRPVHAAIFTLLTACTPSQEATRVELDVALDDAAVEASTNDLGWTVELTEARIAASDVQFTILGEMHGAIASWVPSWILGRAWAHPGHYAGGDVTGEMTGDFILDWIAHPGMKLGTAEMLTGVYHGLNFTFRATGANDKLAADDPLLGHTAHFVGTAHKDELAIAFTIQVDIDANTQLVGAPFDLEVTEDHQATLVVQFLPQDHVEDDSLFDGLDFGVLDDDDDGKVSIVPGDTAHNIFRRTLQSHVHYNVTTR
jgi:hypothetical protein